MLLGSVAKHDTFYVKIGPENSVSASLRGRTSIFNADQRPAPLLEWPGEPLDVVVRLQRLKKSVFRNTGRGRWVVAPHVASAQHLEPQTQQAVLPLVTSFDRFLWPHNNFYGPSSKGVVQSTVVRP